MKVERYVKIKESELARIIEIANDEIVWGSDYDINDYEVVETVEVKPNYLQAKINEDDMGVIMYKAITGKDLTIDKLLLDTVNFLEEHTEDLEAKVADIVRSVQQALGPIEPFEFINIAKPSELEYLADLIVMCKYPELRLPFSINDVVEEFIAGYNEYFG